MHKLSSSDPPASKVLTASPKREISERRRVTFRERVLHLGLEASSTHPGPSTGILRVGFVLLAKIETKCYSSGTSLPPVPLQSLDRAEVKSSHQISSENSNACFKENWFLLAGAARRICFDLNAVAQDFRLYFVPGNLTVLEQHN